MKPTQDPVFLHISELVCKSLESDMTPDESQTLNRYVAADRRYAAYYVRCVRIYSGLKRSPHVQYLFSLEQCENDLKLHSLEALAEYEKIAPAVAPRVPAPAAPCRVSVRNTAGKAAHKINKASLLTAIASLAALVFFIVFARFAPGGSEYVATLTDSIDAQWDQRSDALTHGARLARVTGPYRLDNGVVNLLFDNRAEVLIEGPAEFHIAAEDRLRINYGRVYAVVPRSALGFSVITPNSTIIDLGTEFGVIAGFDGGTELHVIKGETALLTGQHNEKSSILVKEGIAKRVYGAAAAVSDIVPNDRLFVQKIDSEVNLVWRGGAICLADVVGGGSGFGDGVLNRGLNPTRAEFEIFSEIARPTRGPSGYRVLPAASLIDGVFVPNGAAGDVQVSTHGHVFRDCPPTNGEFWQGVFNGAWHGGRFTDIPKHQLRLNGKTYGTGRHPAIYMHANQGITFDLEAIRKSLGGLSLTCFSAHAGISESVLDYPELIVRDGDGRVASPKASFYVLIDGSVRFEAVDMTPEDAPAAIAVAVTAADRFLTLVTTQGTDNMGINHDWTLFAEPVLQIERE